MKKILAVIAASVYLMSPQANAQTITGAGATFPFPIYSKWSEAYKEKANIKHLVVISIVKNIINTFMNL